MGGMKDTLGDTIFDPLKSARRDDPVTSKVAAHSMKPSADHIMGLILAQMHKVQRPMASEEIGDAIGYTVVQIAKRMVDLQNVGLVFRTEEIYRNRSGRPACKFRLTTAKDWRAPLEKLPDANSR